MIINLLRKYLRISGITSFTSDLFKDEQKRYARVRQAYSDKESEMIDLLAKNSTDNTFKLIKEYDVIESVLEGQNQSK